jgi:hypothetical protein
MWQRIAWVSLVNRQGGGSRSQISPTFTGQRSANGQAASVSRGASSESTRVACRRRAAGSTSGNRTQKLLGVRVVGRRVDLLHDADLAELAAVEDADSDVTASGRRRGRGR